MYKIIYFSRLPRLVTREICGTRQVRITRIIKVQNISCIITSTECLTMSLTREAADRRTGAESWPACKSAGGRAPPATTASASSDRAPAMPASAHNMLRYKYH